MMRVAVWLAALAATSCPVLGDNVPFAAPSGSRLGSSSEAYYASLGDIMNVTQSRHIKLAYAGSTANWALASFEIKQIKETFAKAAMFYDHIPIEYVLSIEKPLNAMQHATEHQDGREFTEGFANLTKACNGCHHAANVGFIVIRTPTSSPFSDQEF
jgi:hypothetical protein